MVEKHDGGGGGGVSSCFCVFVFAGLFCVRIHQSLFFLENPNPKQEWPREVFVYDPSYDDDDDDEMKKRNQK